MALHVISNTLDNADGQLARLTKQGSRTGRVIDGIADHLIFVGIYLHLTLRYTAGGGSHRDLAARVRGGAQSCSAKRGGGLFS